ncbi:MAG: hypothetical protein KKB52_03715, partial [Candidatus Omnitrophica bacterium]|nr:hypothetical protein [Candidatus Omnitrophota bacterium]
NYIWYFDSSSPAEGYEYKKEPAVEFSNGLIDIENLGEAEAVLPVINFTDYGNIFPLRTLKTLTESIDSLGIPHLSGTIDHLVLNAMEHQIEPFAAVSMKIERFKDKKILKITIHQESSSKSARDRLSINKEGFDLQGPDYLIDDTERRKLFALNRYGLGFRNIGELMKQRPVRLMYKLGQEEPFPIETNLYVSTEGLSLDKFKQTIPSKDLQTGL